ncbi:MAG TPA: prepilin-type N-terminal cleavage/methylation domain-containing protein [Gemmatimonadales bacterium]|jgi:prepilin-type N-terminal cleavage/methylation domain-containing protein
MNARRGFTLIELMVGLVLVTAVGAVTYALLVQNQRVARSQSEHAGLQDNVRTGTVVVANELREIGYDSIPETAGLAAGASVSPDLLVMERGRLVYKAMRGIGFTCAVPASGQVRLQRTTLLGLRPPEVGDSITAYVEGNPDTGADDAWVHGVVTARGGGICEDGSPAVTLTMTFVGSAAAAAPARMVVGGPVRFFEVMELRYYQSSGKSWLGSRSVSAGGVIEPMLGPLADSTASQRGLTFVYLDRNGVATTIPNEVREIAWTIKGVTDGPVRASGTALAVDSLTLSTSVALRNTLR